ncbi:MAG: hypothetical protein ACLVBJ_02285 [Pilosibacter sp.]
MGYAELLKIVNTYRNSQEVIDIAGNFIQKNKMQITKELKSPKRIEDPVIIYTYDGTLKKPNEDNRAGVNLRPHAVELHWNRSSNSIGKKEKRKIHDPLLGRFGFDGIN